MKKRNGDIGRVSTCQKNCKTIDLRGAQVNQISQHTLLRGTGQQEETLSGIHATELVKLADKMDEICISGKFSVQEPSKWRFLLHTCE